MKSYNQIMILKERFVKYMGRYERLRLQLVYEKGSGYKRKFQRKYYLNIW